MADEDTTAPEFVNLRTNKKLGWFVRLLVTIPAVLLSLTGIGAVYLTDNEIGAAALIVMGGLFGAVVILGHWPRLRMGDSEFDPLVYERGVREGGEAVVRVIAQEVEPDPLPEIDLPRDERDHNRDQDSRQASVRDMVATAAKHAAEGAVNSLSGGTYSAVLAASEMLRSSKIRDLQKEYADLKQERIFLIGTRDAVLRTIAATKERITTEPKPADDDAEESAEMRLEWAGLLLKEIDSRLADVQARTDENYREYHKAKGLPPLHPATEG